MIAFAIYLALFILGGAFTDKPLRQRVVLLLYGLDCVAFMVCSLGTAHVGESFSSAAYRAALFGGWYGRLAVRPIDFVFALLGDPNHCQRVYLEARYDLPRDMRA
jgi:hypothetical protein